MGEETWCVEHQNYDDCEERRWYDAPGPFDHRQPAARAPAAPELSIYEAPTERTLVGNPPPAPPIKAPEDPDLQAASRMVMAVDDLEAIPEVDASVLEWGREPTVPIVAFEEIAPAIDAAAAPPDPVFEAQKATLAAVFEAALAEGVSAGVCNRILFAAVKKLGIAPKTGQ